MEDPSARKSHATRMRVDDIRYPYSSLISEAARLLNVSLVPYNQWVASLEKQADSTHHDTACIGSHLPDAGFRSHPSDLLQRRCPLRW